MKKVIKNASQEPKIFYGLHMCEGIAQYDEPGKQSQTLFIPEQAIRNMDPSFAGKPVFVDHVDEVNLESIQNDADGYVVESFFNKADGKHWVKFIVVSDRGHEAIRNGWKLSNAYIPRGTSGGGLWHGAEYDMEVVSGEYEHLAIVPNPRYAESKILTPEQFKLYNSEKESELSRLANSKERGESTMKFNFFKKAKVENAGDLETTMVELPKSKKEMTVAEVLNAYDAQMMSGAYANGDHKVKVGEEEMTVNELVEKHMSMKSEMAKRNEDDADADAHSKEAEGDAELKPKNEDGDMDEDDLKQNEDKVEEKKEEKKQNAAPDKKEDSEEEKAAKKANFEKLKNAHKVAEKEVKLELSQDKVARGKARYGS